LSTLTKRGRDAERQGGREKTKDVVLHPYISASLHRSCILAPDFPAYVPQSSLGIKLSCHSARGLHWAKSQCRRVYKFIEDRSLTSRARRYHALLTRRATAGAGSLAE